jgi:chromosome segregation ATPase
MGNGSLFTIMGDILTLTFKEKYQVEISNRFAASESLDKSFDINNALESIRENIKNSAKDNLGYQKLKHNKPWFDDECSKLIEEWKQTKLHWLQYPNQINGNNLRNLRHEISRTFRNKEIEYLKGKLMIKTKILEICRGINEFKKRYQPRINIIKMRMIIF